MTMTLGGGAAVRWRGGVGRRRYSGRMSDIGRRRRGAGVGRIRSAATVGTLEVDVVAVVRGGGAGAAAAEAIASEEVMRPCVRRRRCDGFNWWRQPLPSSFRHGGLGLPP